ncbi:hypothetical protein Pflav_083210 [Phytohabitans flavus]|uniref:DUF3817 domain-containing protein n=1 Tax=Phytohabitans flavus TaxID=1076124 RepID=A0A6F8Y7H7_9ACTN|nr:hypothetical protein Pflav_083210 [Phytohabitans flavus]
MGGALQRYRAIAYVVGVVLILLVVVGMPLKYIWDEPAVVETVGPAHGFLYMIYLVAVFDLARRTRWGCAACFWSCSRARSRLCRSTRSGS